MAVAPSKRAFTLEKEGNMYNYYDIFKGNENVIQSEFIINIHCPFKDR